MQDQICQKMACPHPESTTVCMPGSEGLHIAGLNPKVCLERAAPMHKRSQAHASKQHDAFRRLGWSSVYQALREGELWHGFACLQLSLLGLLALPIALPRAIPATPQQGTPLSVPGLPALLSASCHTTGSRSAKSPSCRMSEGQM